MLKNLTIKARLMFVIGFLSLLTVIIGLVALSSLGANNASMQSIYKDRVVRLGELSTILTLIEENQITVASALTGDPAQLNTAADEVKGRIAKIDVILTTYLASNLTPEEKILSDRFAESRKKFVESGLGPALVAMRAGDIPTAATALRGPLTTLIKPVQSNMNALVQIQLDISKTEYLASQARYDNARFIAVVEILVGMLVGVMMTVWLIGSISRSLAQALKLARSVAEGDLTQKVDIKSQDEIGQLLLAMRAMNAKLVTIVGEVQVGADTIATASREIASGNLDLSSRTEQQAASLEETASSMEELTSTVKQNADNAYQANELAVAASGVAAQGRALVSQVVDTMASIDISAKRIGDIISVIDGIAFQTNILALNAAVEAARAGEQGRGFAVVASEVRSLAQRSAAAAKEVKTLVGDAIDKVDAGSKLVSETGSTMAEIVDHAKRVTDIMAEIMAATHEQSAGIKQVNQAIGQMDEVTQQNAALVEQAAAAAGSLQDQAANLAQVVGIFKRDNIPGSGVAKVVAARLPAIKRPALPVVRRPAVTPPQLYKKPAALQAPVRTPAASTAGAPGDWEEF